MKTTFIKPFINKNSPFIGIRDFFGFTLVELAITLLVISIVSMIAVPAYQDFVDGTRLSAATNDLIADISYARIEAIKRQNGQNGTGRVAVCTSSNGTGCTGGAWQMGWIVFWDDDSNNAVNGGDVVLKIHEPLPDILEVASDPGGTVVLSFGATGQMGVPNPTSLNISSSNSGKNRLLCFSSSGRTMLRENTNSCTN